MKRSVFPDMARPGQNPPVHYPFGSLSPAQSGSLSRSLGILIPDIVPYISDRGGLDLRDLLFFDLETSGLSGGAGTVAFLAAFGRIVPNEESDAGVRKDPFLLKVDQYLLLDHSGEIDFLDALLEEFTGTSSPGEVAAPPPLVISYNGKSFDAQILKTRCILNGIRPPPYYHADLLHPSRRLWKRVLPSCSQGEIETAVLGLDRTGDIPGALAPEIWFSFLRTGDFSSLGGICDHNIKDISGLANLFFALADIAHSPLERAGAYRADMEALALIWREAKRRDREGLFGEGAGETGMQLLAAAADSGYPRAVYTMALDLLRRNRYEEGRRLLLDAAEAHNPERIRAAAYRALAVDSEWRLGDAEGALGFVQAALDLEEIRGIVRTELRGRRERLLKKAGRPGIVLCSTVSGEP
jgi:uncharacterized protein YprB with RNaseH-like and TPR domain